MSLQEPTETETGRDAILSTLEETIDDVHKRIQTREVETVEDEQMLIKWHRTLGYLSGQHRKLMKDTDIDEMADELELLREVTGRGDER